MTMLTRSVLVCKITILMLSFYTSSLIAQNTNFPVNDFKGHLKFLSNDLLRGRLPGDLGGDIAALYIASQFEKLGLQPISDKHGYFQPVPTYLVRVW